MCFPADYSPRTRKPLIRWDKGSDPASHTIISDDFPDDLRAGGCLKFRKLNSETKERRKEKRCAILSRIRSSQKKKKGKKGFISDRTSKGWSRYLPIMYAGTSLVEGKAFELGKRTNLLYEFRIKGSICKLVSLRAYEAMAYTPQRSDQ